MKNIWKKLPKHFVDLAPMAGVTDFPFREILCEIGKSDLFFTEFVSTEHVVRHPDKVPLILKYSKKQKPIIAQFFGCKPKQFEYCAELAVKLGFDGIDINMGCPDRKVQKQGAGSELIRNSELAREIIRSAIRGCGGKIPVSIKTRLGYNKKDIGDWIFDILGEGVSAITIHGRTVKQGYVGEADWEAIGEITKKIKKSFPDITVIGNGDIKDIEQGKILAKKYGVDGVMIGRAVLKNPWIFSKSKSTRIKDESLQMNPNIKERIRVALKHTNIFEKFYNDEKSFALLKKYYKGYLSGVPVDLVPKKELMECKNIDEAKTILKSQITNYK